MIASVRRLRDDESGSILPLTIFFGALSLALIVVVVAATSLYLERKRLYTVADGAALAGAEAFDLDAVTVTPEGPRAELRPRDVAAAVDDYLADAGTGRLDEVVVERATTTDGRSATVELSASWRPPVLTLVLPEGIRLEVTAVARSVLR
ncbi:putative Flp pilus-assembly TadE/G-like protein [Diaminobutyricimonas aerilata]|uniref:Putative Flp pilus-assembly TadE/G-like protein n=1 Tax=Diaminobutyricimonas aerilata TaxID=1162967 RepID=A0A2M9CHS2_9MICO|nr:pilus assembly protein TadG-related protein [Diaminobutyricimonas aerilata]PJJ71405.1 putative Flp pilus-assembly TadE/G-like protein [Diaminobutyricimonas aerilata]